MTRHWIFWCFWGLAQLPVYAQTQSLCRDFEVVGPETISLTEAEKRLVCGDTQSEAWRNVPESQAIFHFRTFLQDRGYFSPSFTSKDGKVIADIGKPTDVTSFDTIGEPRDLPITRLRGIVGERLTPRLLNEVEKRVMSLLLSRGYACPTIKMDANSSTGDLRARMEAGPKQKILRIDEQPIPGVDEKILSRYHAFRLGDTYNADFLNVTVNRILREGVLQSTHFRAECTKDGAVLEQRVIAGPSRNVSVGFGVNTERFALLRASWKNQRLWENASNLEVNLTASFLDQEINARSAWYYLPGPTRHYLLPTLQIRHDNRPGVPRTISTRLGLAPAVTVDWADLGLSANAGPQVNVAATIQGQGPSFTQFMTIAGETKLISHYYEFYQAAPRTGFETGLDVLLAQKDAFSSFTARRYRLNFSKLWNFLDYDPPLLVFGVRGGLAVVDTPEDVVTSTRLTNDFRQFLGGSNDLRGFGLTELPYSPDPKKPTGALTAAYLSVEARLADGLPLKLQPFLFLDLGKLGKKSFAFDEPLYWSPGLGIRWQSPVGVIRATLAHGYMANNPGTIPATVSHRQFFFSFGEEF